MTADDDTGAGPFGPISRRSAIGSTLLAGAAFLTAQPIAAQDAARHRRSSARGSATT